MPNEKNVIRTNTLCNALLHQMAKATVDYSKKKKNTHIINDYGIIVR